jgi:folate-binding protein YgfZ
MGDAPLFFRSGWCQKAFMNKTTGECEARAACEAVLAVRAADRAALIVRGRDRSSWLNGLVTCDLARLGPTDGAYGLLVEKKGRIQTDFFAIPSRAGDALALAVPRELRGGILEMLDHYLIMEDAELEAGDLGFWQLHGPRACEAADAIGAPFSGRLDLLGVGGAVVGAPQGEASAFAERLRSAVERMGGAVTDEATWEAIRIERGLPRFGVEVDPTLYPQEASLEKLAVSFEKGCYLGQEVVYMLENRGHVKRKLVPLEIEGSTPPAKGEPVTTAEGTPVGDVKSSVIGPLSGKPVALAMIKWAQTKPGTELRIGDRVARVRA